jgi:hypothetical protein
LQFGCRLSVSPSQLIEKEKEKGGKEKKREKEGKSCRAALQQSQE